MELPNDPIIKLSYLNTMLRDKYSSLDELCEDNGINKEDILTEMKAVGFEYNPEQNKFW